MKILWIVDITPKTVIWMYHTFELFVINLHLHGMWHRTNVSELGLNKISKIIYDPQYSLIFHDIGYHGYYPTFQAISFLV